MSFVRILTVAVFGATTTVLFACSSTRVPDETYFERVVAPILQTSCARSPTGSGCHVADERGNAFGNLDVTSFARLDKRRDLLATYGPYGEPSLLLKVLPGAGLHVRAYDGTGVVVTSDVRHTGGSILEPGTTGYATLERWIINGATENNTGKRPLPIASTPCSQHIPSTPGFDVTKDPTSPDWPTFRDRVSSRLAARCGAGNCHGMAMNELVLTCGDTVEQARYNYFVAVEYLGKTPDQSELLRKPLAPFAGGSFHEGGIVFENADDPDLTLLSNWVAEHGPLVPPDLGPGFDFFAHRVQPVLVRKGCMQLQCHSSASFHDYRLRGGVSGSFSFSATRKNYDLSVDQLALESDDPRASRLVRKNLYRPEVAAGGQGIVHRGGPLFEDVGGPATPGACDGKGYDYDDGDLDQIPAFCIVREWLRRERAGRTIAPLSGIAYVRRALSSSPDRVQDFDVYRPGSDLRLVDATMDATGMFQLVSDRSVTAGCGLDPKSADIQRPAVSGDASRIAFAARSSASEPLRIFEMKADGTECAPHAAIDAGPPTASGLLVHQFDPAYGPPDAAGVPPLVFASTRGNLDVKPYDYQGPQRTPADPTKPNSNLYVYERDPAKPGAMRIRQLTFLLDMERGPSFMADGRVVFTVEKRLAGFHQLSLRRINLDGGDYHPLYGQRGSIGFASVSQVVHLADKNFAAVFADHGVPHHGGALGVFNRSLGVDFGSANPADYVFDPALASGSSATQPHPSFFLHSLRIPDKSATGRAAGGSSGFYSSPTALPDGRVLASFGAASDAASFDGDYDVVVVDLASGARTPLFGTVGQADVEAVAIYGRAARRTYTSSSSEPNAYGMDESRTTADVLVHDMASIASLLLQNTPAGRPIDPDLHSFKIYEELPPSLEVTTFDAGGANVVTDEFGMVYVRRRLLGEVPIEVDGSARYLLPGGLPLQIELASTPLATTKKIQRFVNEHLMFTPGESVHEGFRHELFDGFCGQCHGASSGRPLDAAMRPDIFASASITVAATRAPTNLDIPPLMRGTPTGP
ncbi:hypothetical protein BH09MYX1_BH09MYX1_30420 [soil metagenome]